MNDILDKLLAPGAPNRLLIEAELTPVMGRRFQPTGFPDLGAATYETAEGQFLVVESSQSMANRLEAVCWDEGSQGLTSAIRGLSYVRVEDPDGAYVTSSITESHRLNSPYILESKDQSFLEQLAGETEDLAKGPVDRPRLASVLFKYDASTLLHGVFLAKGKLAGGRLRVERALTSFIEAEGVRVAPLGGVKKDEVNPQGDTKKGFGHVPFHRDEYTADRIVAYFKLDLAQIRAYGLDGDATRLLVALGLFKIASVLEGGLRLRTACDLELSALHVKRPEDFELPGASAIAESLPALVAACSSQFAVTDGVTRVVWKS